MRISKKNIWAYGIVFFFSVFVFLKTDFFALNKAFHISTYCFWLHVMYFFYLRIAKQVEYVVNNRILFSQSIICIGPKGFVNINIMTQETNNKTTLASAACFPCQLQYQKTFFFCLLNMSCDFYQLRFLH